MGCLCKSPPPPTPSCTPDGRGRALGWGEHGCHLTGFLLHSSAREARGSRVPGEAAPAPPGKGSHWSCLPARRACSPAFWSPEEPLTAPASRVAHTVPCQLTWVLLGFHLPCQARVRPQGRPPCIQTPFGLCGTWRGHLSIPVASRVCILPSSWNCGGCLRATLTLNWSWEACLVDVFVFCFPDSGLWPRAVPLFSLAVS